MSASVRTARVAALTLSGFRAARTARHGAGFSHDARNAEALDAGAGAIRLRSAPEPAAADLGLARSRARRFAPPRARPSTSGFGRSSPDTLTLVVLYARASLDADDGQGADDGSLISSRDDKHAERSRRIDRKRFHPG